MDGKEVFGHLPIIKIEGIKNPVVSIMDEKSKELIYSFRIRGNEFKPKVFNKGSYKITVTDTDNDITKELKGILPTQKIGETIFVKF